jgi:aspartate/methionine/tyrosine aminotransferase
MVEPFKLERFFARYEFQVKYLLSASDCEGLPLSELLELAPPQTLSLWKDLKLGYTESQGHPLLREEIARLYRSTSTEQIVVAVPEEAIFIAMQTLLRPGDHVISIFPAYQSLYELAHSIGCEVTYWNLRQDSQGWYLDLEGLQAALRPNTRLLVINFPHNPTGFLPTLDELQAVLDFAARHDLMVFSDEMYRLLEYSEADRLPPVCDLYEKGISLSGFSKSFALAGLRLGWLATRAPGLLGAWLAYKDYTTICSSAPSEILGLMALQAQETILARSRRIVLENLSLAAAFFTHYSPLFLWLPPRAGSVAFPRWNGSISLEQLCKDLLDLRSLMLLPGSIFDFPGPHFRIGLGRQDFPQALQALEMHLDGLPHP